MKPLLFNLLISSALTFSTLTPTTNVHAQKTISKTIVITNGDTVVNGKKLSDLSKKEREQFVKEFNSQEKGLLEQQIDEMVKNGKPGDVVIRKLRRGGSPDEIRMLQLDGDSGKLVRDSVHIQFRHRLGEERDLAMVEPDFNGTGPGHPAPMRDHFRRNANYKGSPDIRNTQTLHFSNADRDGFVTETNYHISDATEAEIQKISGREASNASLTVNDFTVFPNFSSGKTSISFSLNGKGTANISVMDSGNNVLFNDKVANTTGSYLKQVTMAKNGIYFVSIEQNGKWLVKKVIKL